MLDVWSIFMAKAGWKEGEALIGSKKVARNEVLERLLVDGELSVPRPSRKLGWLTSIQDCISDQRHIGFFTIH